MKCRNAGIIRHEEYRENSINNYRLPNTSTMENLSMKVTAGEGAVLKMERIPITLRCEACGAENAIDKRNIRCPACGSTQLKLLTGHEFYVESLEVD